LYNPISSLSSKNKFFSIDILNTENTSTISEFTVFNNKSYNQNNFSNIIKVNWIEGVILSPTHIKHSLLFPLLPYNQLINVKLLPVILETNAPVLTFGFNYWWNENEFASILTCVINQSQSDYIKYKIELLLKPFMFIKKRV